MTAREFLNQAYKIDLRIDSKREQIERLNLLATKCTSTLTGMPHNPSSSTSPMADAICAIVDLEAEISENMKQLIQIKHDIMDVIECVNNAEYRTILERRYISECTWEEIAVEMHYSNKWIRNMHSKALAVVDRILKEKAAA